MHFLLAMFSHPQPTEQEKQMCLALGDTALIHNSLILWQRGRNQEGRW